MREAIGKVIFDGTPRWEMEEISKKPGRWSPASVLSAKGRIGQGSTLQGSHDVLVASSRATLAVENLMHPQEKRDLMFDIPTARRTRKAIEHSVL